MTAILDKDLINEYDEEMEEIISSLTSQLGEEFGQKGSLCLE